MRQYESQPQSAIASDGTRIVFHTIPAHKQNASRVVLIHALAMSHRQWDEVVAALSGACHLLMVDCRGHGDSDPAKGPYTCELFADDIRTAMDRAGWAAAIIAGCSMGGCVAQAFAINYPDRTDGLLLIDTTATYGLESVAGWKDRAQRALNTGMIDLVEFQLHRWFTDEFIASNPDIVQRCVDIFVRTDTASYASACTMLAQTDLRSGLGCIQCPTIVVVGQDDYATPICMAQDIVNKITSAKIEILPMAKHFSPVERPAEISRILRQLSTLVIESSSCSQPKRA